MTNVCEEKLNWAKVPSVYISLLIKQLLIEHAVHFYIHKKLTCNAQKLINDISEMYRQQMFLPTN